MTFRLAHEISGHVVCKKMTKIVSTKKILLQRIVNYMLNLVLLAQR